MRFALHIARDLIPDRKPRHDCSRFVEDLMCYPPACCLCGRTIGVADMARKRDWWWKPVDRLVERVADRVIEKQRAEREARAADFRPKAAAMEKAINDVFAKGFTLHNDARGVARLVSAEPKP